MDKVSRDRLRLKDVMLRRYLRLGETHTVAEVMGFLSDPRFEKESLPFLVVISQSGAFAGILEPKAVFRCLAEGLVSGASLSSGFLELAPARLKTRVGDIMSTGIPTLPGGALLEEAFLCINDSATGVIAVVEEERVIGLVTRRILFEQASSLTVGALSGGVIPPR